MRTERNENRRKLDMSAKYGSHANCVHLNVNNSLKHELKKCSIAYKLLKRGKEVWTEVKFQNGMRADVYCSDLDTAFEVVNTETEASLNRKRNSYPVANVVVIHCMGD